MKRQTLIIALAVIMALLSVSCNSYRYADRARPMGPEKEEVGRPQRPVEINQPVPTVQIPGDDESQNQAFGTNFSSGALSYIVDGEAFTGEVHTDEDLTTLYLKLLGYAKLGHSICVAAHRGSCQGERGETVNYSSSNEHEVAAWASKMIKKGYSVTIDYDKSSRTYHCTAYKSK